MRVERARVAAEQRFCRPAPAAARSAPTRAAAAAAAAARRPATAARRRRRAPRRHDDGDLRRVAAQLLPVAVLFAGETVLGALSPAPRR